MFHLGVPLCPPQHLDHKRHLSVAPQPTTESQATVIRLAEPPSIFNVFCAPSQMNFKTPAGARITSTIHTENEGWMTGPGPHANSQTQAHWMWNVRCDRSTHPTLRAPHCAPMILLPLEWKRDPKTSRMLNILKAQLIEHRRTQVEKSEKYKSYKAFSKDRFIQFTCLSSSNFIFIF